MTTTPRFGFILEYVADIEAARRFYVDVLGFTVERESPNFAQLRDAGGTAIALAADEPVGGKRTTELYWVVDDAEAALADLSARANISVPLTEYPFGRVFAIADPDGHPRYVVEFARTRPSQAVA